MSETPQRDDGGQAENGRKAPCVVPESASVSW